MYTQWHRILSYKISTAKYKFLQTIIHPGVIRTRDLLFCRWTRRPLCPADRAKVYFHTKNPHFGIFWRALEWKIWYGYVMATRYILYIVRMYMIWQFDIFFGCLVHFFSFWYIVPRIIWQPCEPLHSRGSIIKTSSGKKVLEFFSVEKISVLLFSSPSCC
jgi:hypothetical protein